MAVSIIWGVLGSALEFDNNVHAKVRCGDRVLHDDVIMKNLSSGKVGILRILHDAMSACALLLHY